MVISWKEVPMHEDWLKTIGPKGGPDGRLHMCHNLHVVAAEEGIKQVVDPFASSDTRDLAP